ncbi:molybdopterin molybdotransferase MoeA [Erythrobacter alti]|uniref:molybdopterin molybdotransferase MoeA n=1 Tax=Erythrobacter alti TaxID=1896145 RepID=UPI0030F46887
MNLPPPISMQDAQSRLLALAQPLEAETVAIENAAGRFLASDIIARRTQPPADLSAMDGFAVGDNDPSGSWRVVGESAAGHPFEGTFGKGDAVRISTGALMPEGASAVLLQEDAQLDGNDLRVASDATASPRHIRHQGFDFTAGDALLRTGTRMDAARCALAIAGGQVTVDVGRKARLSVIDSGDELVADAATARDHQIPASNGAMLGIMASPFCESSHRIGPVPDRREKLVKSFDDASTADVIIISGGASVGDHDLVRPALEQWGAKLDFWRVAMKPGKPLLVARKGTKIILGLPGNPVSSYVTAFFFLLPLLRHLAGSYDPMPQSLALSLAADLPANGSRTEFIRGVMCPEGAQPLLQRDSSALRTLAAADCFIERGGNAPPARTGDPVTVYPLQNGGIA